MQNVTGATSAAGVAAPEKPSLKSRALDELRQYAVITLYLWLLFALFSFYRRMILQEHRISIWGQSFAIINALVFAKVILIAQALHLEEVARAIGGQALWDLFFSRRTKTFKLVEE